MDIDAGSVFNSYYNFKPFLLPAVSGLPPPTIVSNEVEFVLQPNSVFNISCTGKRNVVWAEPLPKNTFVYPGYYTATLFIYNATVENTRYYTCTYETQESDAEDIAVQESEAEIYVFVPGGFVHMMMDIFYTKRVKLSNGVFCCSKSNFSFEYFYTV